jgi:hypothetical protein
MKIIDNWLEPHLAEFLSTYLFSDIVYTTGASSRCKEDQTSFLHGQVPLDSLMRYLVFKLNHIKPVSVIRIYTNLHYNNMGGDFHEDDGDTTFIYMPSQGLKDDEGHFEIKDEPLVEYKFNRLIMFDAKRPHRGHRPKQNIPRVTLAFKTNSLIK